MTALEYIKMHWKDTIKDKTDEIPYPYTSPSISGHYVDFYYWDNYFINKGLLLSGLYKDALNNVRNIRYFIKKYGYMPNCNNLLNRTQPPVYTLCLKDLYEYSKDKEIIKEFIDASVIEYNFFMTERMTLTGLNSYQDSEKDMDHLINTEYRWLKERVKEYSDNLDEQIIIAKDILAIAESGLDFNMRFKTSKSKIAAHEFVHLDLNSILYKVEEELSYLFNEIGELEESKKYLELSIKRKELMNKYFYDKENKVYLDYNFIENNHSIVYTAVSLYPHAFNITNDKESCLNIIKRLEYEYGLSFAEDRGDDIYYQWDYPVLWAEVMYIAYLALKNTGLDSDAERIKNKYIKTIDLSFSKTNELYEKYDARTGEVMNVEYDAPPFMGWTAAIYQLFKEGLE